MDSIIDTILDFINDNDEILDVWDNNLDLDEVFPALSDHSSVSESLHSDNMFASFKDFSNSHNISFQGKPVEELIDTNKNINVHSAGGGGSYTLDVYKDRFGNTYLARHNGKIAECITGKAQIDLGPNFVVKDIKKKL